MDSISWLVGVIDGEGCFQITERGVPDLSVMVSHRDAQLAEACKAAAGVGVVRHYPDAPRIPVSVWNVRSKVGLGRMVQILDEFALRSRKDRDYQVWRLAVNVQAQRRVGGNIGATRNHNAPLTAELMRLRKELMEVRKN